MVLTIRRPVGRCRTSELGGHLEECDSCGYQRPARFVRIRHFGLLVAGNVNSRLELARTELTTTP
jgi:hypothetical protein